MKLVYDSKKYAEYISSDIEKFKFKRPLFIEITQGCEIRIATKEVIYTSIFSRNEKDVLLTEEVAKLLKKNEYVIYTTDGVIGTEKEILCNFSKQPRESSFSYLVGEELSTGMVWFRTYNTSFYFHNLVFSHFLTNVDTISQKKEISELGKAIYANLVSENLQISLYREKEIEPLFSLNERNYKAPFYSYIVRDLLREVFEGEPA